MASSYTSADASPSQPPRLLDQRRSRIRSLGYSLRTEESYVHWIRRYTLFHGKRPSDASFISPWCAQALEFGPVNDSIHKINEHVIVADLDRLSAIYEGTLRRRVR